MKSTDIALIIFIAIVSIGISYFGMNALMGDPSDKYEKIEYINDISGVVAEPDKETFNVTALNLNEDVKSGKCSYGEVYDGLRCVTQEEYDKEMSGSTENNSGENTENTENTDNTDNTDNNNTDNSGENLE